MDVVVSLTFGADGAGMDSEWELSIWIAGTMDAAIGVRLRRERVTRTGVSEFRDRLSLGGR